MASAAQGPARASFRSIMRAAREFPDVNIKSWIERRAREDFRKLVGETDKQVIAAAIAKAEEHVKLLQRSSAVYSMYAPKHATILNVPKDK